MKCFLEINEGCAAYVHTPTGCARVLAGTPVIVGEVSISLAEGGVTALKADAVIGKIPSPLKKGRWSISTSGFSEVEEDRVRATLGPRLRGIPLVNIPEGKEIFAHVTVGDDLTALPQGAWAEGVRTDGEFKPRLNGYRSRESGVLYGEVQNGTFAVQYRARLGLGTTIHRVVEKIVYHPSARVESILGALKELQNG
jgi:hypothetical protein